MTPCPTYDAIIVGAGPAGSTTAALLARNGFKVLLLDKAAFPRDKACGEYSSPQTEQVLARTGALSRVEPHARRLSEMHLISPGGRRVVMDYGVASNGTRQVLATPRRELDAALVDHARASGVEVRERVRVEGVCQANGRATGVVVRERGGQTQELAARIVIGADGTNSVVARALGVVAALRWPRNLGMVAHYSGHSGLDNWAEMHVSTRGYAGLAPLSNGLVNVGLVMPMTGARNENGQGSVARFEKFAMSFPGVAERLAGAERVSAVRGAGPIGARVKRAYGEGFLLVGDAAGFFDPFTGEGVHKALRGAELAAQVATQCLNRDDLSAGALSRYATLRRREFASKEIVCRLVQLFVVMPGMMDYIAGRLPARPGTLNVMTGVIGDFADARAALSPLYLWSLLRP